MSMLGDSLWSQYGGNLPANPQQVAQQAIARYGSGRAAARALGVDEAQIRRWKAGNVRNSPNVARIVREARRSAVENLSGPVVVKFKFAGRDRNLAMGEGQGHRGLTDGTDDRIAEAFIDGDRERMAKALVDGVSDPFYRKQLSLAYVAELMGAPGDAGEKSDAVGAFRA